MSRKTEPRMVQFRKIGFGLSATLFGLLVLVCSAWGEYDVMEARMLDEIEIRLFAAGKKVIPVVCEIGDWQIMDIKLPDLVVTNNRRSLITIERVEVIGTVGEISGVSIQISGKELAEAIRKTANKLNHNRPPLASLQLTYGNLVLPEGVLSENGKATPGQSVLLPLSAITYLHYVGHSKVDSLRVVVTIKVGREGWKKKFLSFPVRLTFYENKGKYVFPLRGDLHGAMTPLSYIHHRGAGSQEFAMDVVGAVQQGATDFTEISTPHPKTLSDYGIWGREVIAIGDGTVVEIGDKFPEERMSDPAKFTDSQYVQNLLKELVGEIGWANAIAGNYVTIDHGKGEYSIYCHLKEGSIRVMPGDRVTRGMVIGQVGNTGNSGAPHLHFQLMDSQDFFTSNGLPMMFENVPGSVIITEYPVKANTLSFSDSLFFSVP